MDTNNIPQPKFRPGNMVIFTKAISHAYDSLIVATVEYASYEYSGWSYQLNGWSGGFAESQLSAFENAIWKETVVFREETTSEKIRKLIAQEFRLEPSRVTNSALLTQDLNFGEHDRSELTMILEDNFQINLIDDLEEAATIADVIKIVCRQI